MTTFSQQHATGNDLISKWTGKSIYVDKDTPDATNDFNKVDVIVMVEGLLPVGGGTVTLDEIDPANASVPDAVGDDNNGAALSFAPGSLSFTNSNMTQTSTVTLGINAGDNYIVKATANNGQTNNIVKSEILTVWRRLWVELDQMYASSGFKPNVSPKEPNDYQSTDPLAMAFPAGILAPGSHIATQLARACIVPEVFTANSVVEVPGALQITPGNGDDGELTIRSNINRLKSGINQQSYRSVNHHDKSFWTVQVVNAFYGPTSASHGGNMILMFNETIQSRLASENHTDDFDVIYPIVLLHEIGHALWLPEAFDKDDPNDQPVPGVTYGVMLNKGPLSLHLENDNDKFTVENIQRIQKMGVPDYGPGANRPR